MGMKALNNDPKQTELASGFTVAQYEAACRAKDKDTISCALHRRFMERYINPVTEAGQKHGFTMMAISCLMIESLESFRRGWKNSNNKSEAAFCYFFSTNDSFREFRNHCEQFYKNVRYGILHQAETTGGWRIRRDGPLFDSASLIINAQCFLDNLCIVLNDFCGRLKSAECEWDSPEWQNVRKKMSALCENCRP
jgi:hypothetical protein